MNKLAVLETFANTGMHKQAFSLSDIAAWAQANQGLLSGIGTGAAAGLGTYALGGLVPGLKKNKLARLLLGLIAGGAGYKYGPEQIYNLRNYLAHRKQDKQLEAEGKDINARSMTPEEYKTWLWNADRSELGPRQKTRRDREETATRHIRENMGEGAFGIRAPYTELARRDAEEAKERLDADVRNYFIANTEAQPKPQEYLKKKPEKYPFSASEAGVPDPANDKAEDKTASLRARIASIYA